MRIKFRSIELFGVAGSGKSYIREKIKKKLSSEGYKILGTREIIIKKIKEFTNLTIVEKIIISYFNLLLSFNITTTLWNKILSKIIDKYLYKRKKKYDLFNKKLEKIFNKNLNINFNYHKIWIKELIIATMLFDDLKKKDKKIIFFPDEGFVQKIFLINYSNQKKEVYLIKNYLNQKIFCDLIINIKSSKNFILKVMKKRKLMNKEWIMTESEINQMIKIEKKIKRIKTLNFKILTNSSNINKILNKKNFIK